MLDFSKKLFVLAPLAGYTDMPFRSVVKKFGADLTVSEMISSNALVHNPKKTYQFIQKSENENPFSAQINGYSEDIVRRAVELLNSCESVDIIDFNCGCPAPKIVGNNSGAALLKEPQKMRRLIEVIKINSKKRLTSVKMRIGYESKNGVELALAAQDGGADFIAVHGRTRAQKYTGEVDYDEIGRIKAAVKVPVIANGDITSYEKAMQVLDITGADGVMIGRAAVGAPWIFYQLKQGSKELDAGIKQLVVLEHFDRMIEFYGDFGVKLFRKHLHTYTKGHDGAASFRTFINSESDKTLVRECIEEFFSCE